MISFIITHAIAAWLILGMLFLGYPTIKRLKEHRDMLDWTIKVPVYCALVLGVLADVVFNLLWGTVIFRELPREFLFTTRLKRQWRENENPRAERWVNIVNLIDPGHV